MARTYALLGASGMVGGRLLGLLSADPAYARGTLVGRRILGLASPNVREVVVDFDRPESYRDHLAVDDVFCCLGTTIRKAGSQAAFRKVDAEIPAAVGREARAAGAKQFLIVTAVGANAQSSVFYNRVKGEVEAALTAIDFPWGLKVFHPSMILGDRAESRPAERVAKVLMSATSALFVGGLARYKAIDAMDVARAMRRVALEGPLSPGATAYEGERLFAMSR